MQPKETEQEQFKDPNNCQFLKPYILALLKDIKKLGNKQYILYNWIAWQKTLEIQKKYDRLN